MINFGTEAASVYDGFKNVAVVTGRLALPQSEDVSKANQHRSMVLPPTLRLAFCTAAITSPTVTFAARIFVAESSI